MWQFRQLGPLCNRGQHTWDKWVPVRCEVNAAAEAIVKRTKPIGKTSFACWPRLFLTARRISDVTIPEVDSVL
jgi:hypothetical protein